MADVTFSIEFNSNGEAVLKGVTGAIDGLSDKARNLEKPVAALEKFDGSLRPANQALNILTGQLGVLGPVGNAAGNAVFQLADGVTRGTVAVGAFAVGVAAAGNALRQSSDEANAFGAAVSSRDRDFFSSGIERLQNIAADRGGIVSGAISLVKGLFGETDRLVFDLTGKIGDYQSQLSRVDASRVQEVTAAFQLQAQAIGASPVQKIGIEAQVQINQLNQLFDARKIGIAEYRASLAGVEAVRGAGVAEFNRNIRDQIDLLKAANDPLAQIEIRLRNIRQGADSGTLGNLSELQRLQENAARIAAGAPLVAQGFAQIGSSTAIPKAQLDQLAIAAFNLDKQFQAGLLTARQYSEGLKSIAQGGLPGQEREFLQQIQSVKTEFSSIAKQDFPAALQFDQILGKLQGIKDAARETFGLDIPPSVTAQIQNLQSMVQEIAQEKKLTLSADASNAFFELDRIQAKINSLQNQSIDLTVNTLATGSPTMSFSKYFTDYAPNVLQNFAKTAPSITFDSGMASLVSRLAFGVNSGVSFLQGVNPTGIDPSVYGVVSAGVAANQQAIDLIKNSLGIQTMLGPKDVVAPRIATAGGSSGGGSSGGAVVNIDLRGASLDRQSLDDTVIPALERGIIRATGQLPNIRVFN